MSDHPASGQTKAQDPHADRPTPQTPLNSQPQALDGPLPRPARQRRRAKADRGLPPDHELARLATEYLGRQRKHWPDLVKAGLLPDGPDAIAAMVEDFKSRHRTGEADPTPLEALRKLPLKLAGSYNRYSCDNSSPTSIVDQMVHALDKARQEGRFVPWAYLFADYSVSGLHPSRQGYAVYKKLMQDKEHYIETTYVDDSTRASRDEIEWWKLASLAKRLGKRMVGASDGFDLSATDWEMKVGMYGLLSRLFLKGLKEKVRRGMRGAARRGTCLGKLSLGFTRLAARDDRGNVLLGADDRPVYKPCVDPTTRDYRVLLYELFVEKCWSVYQITRHFNQLKVDGWDGWSQSAIRGLLRSPDAVGVFIWNRRRQEYDWEEERFVTVTNPRSQWEVYHDPALALVPIKLWAAARKRLAALRRKSLLTGRKPSRNQRSASTLFSGTLTCGYCGKELLLCRSAGKYKVMGCLNGLAGVQGCQLTTTKSTRIIETCLLRFLQDRLLTEKTVEKLVAHANEFLTQESGKPRVDTAPLRARIREKEASIKKLFERIEGQENEGLCRAYDRRIAELQKEVTELKGQLHTADEQNVLPPPPLDVAAVKALLADLRGLLGQEIPAAAEAIRALTGPIKIRQERVPGKKQGARWIATFTPDLLGWLRQNAMGKDCPDSVSLEYLCARIWITPETVEVAIDQTPKYETISPRAAELAAGGASVNTIASALNTTWPTVAQALEFARTGRRPKTKPAGTRTGKGQPRWKRIDPAEVVRLRHESQLSFVEIGRRLGITEATVARIYDRGNPQAVWEAAERGQKPRRGRRSRLGPEVFERIRVGLRGGQAPEKIAADVGCGVSTVYRVRRAMQEK
jgi:DNA invertase Pin-like site-specific DNA recombinase